MGLVVEQSAKIKEQFSAGAPGIDTTGQLMIAEYDTLAVIGKAGLGTPHRGGNIRLGTATAVRSLIESFGTDGQPGSYTDLDTTAAVFLVGYNIASFHYGDFDGDGRPRAANELTMSGWDPVSKQPHFKYAAVAVAKVTLASHPSDAAGAFPEAAHHTAAAVKDAVGGISAAAGERHMGDHLGLILGAEQALAESFEEVGARHTLQPGMPSRCKTFAAWSRGHAGALAPVVTRDSANRHPEPSRL